jgi:hypothetical protein
VACLVAQFYGGYYMGYFAVLVLGLLAFWSLALPGPRRVLLRALRRDGLAGLALAGAGALLLLPLARHYLAVLKFTGQRSYADVEDLLPRWQSWCCLGSASYWYEWLARHPLMKGLTGEQYLGLGFLTSAVALGGLVLHRRRPAVALMLLTTASVMVLATRYPGGHSPWWFVWRLAPGGAALRAVGRVGLLLLVPAGAGLALVVDWAADTKKAFALAVVLAVACCGEQLVRPLTYSKSRRRSAEQALAGQIDPSKRAFVVSCGTGDRPPPYVLQLDAMYASSRTGVPTVNGYSGNAPVGWWDPFERMDTGDERRRADFEKGIASWARSHGLGPSEVQWLEIDGAGEVRTRPRP